LLLATFLFSSVAAIEGDEVSNIVAELSVEGGSLPYPFDDLKRMVIYSYMAYCNQGAIKNYNCAFCGAEAKGFQMTFYSYDAGTQTAGMVGVNPVRKEIIVAFRGTLPHLIQNYLVDIKFFKTKYHLPHTSRFNTSSIDNAQIHSGFFDAFKNHAAPMSAEILKVMDQYPDYPVFFTGHSMGAALAVYSMLDLAYNHDPQVDIKRFVLITFGLPRMGNDDFVEVVVATGIPTYRFVHKNDWVVHLPQQSWGFKHFPREIWEKQDDKFIICDTTGEDPKCSNSLRWYDFNFQHHITYFDTLFLTCGFLPEEVN